MKGIVINIDPVAFQLGPFTLTWYALAIVGAISAAILVAARESERKGVPKKEVYSLAFWAVLAGFVGARLFHVVDKLDYYSADPWSILALQRGGLAIWGGVIGGVLTGVVYAKIKHLPLGRLADVAAPALLIGQIIGRIGCIVNGDAYGGPTTLPWGFIYTHPHALTPQALKGIPIHPYPVYEMLWNLAVLLSLWKVRRRIRTEGLLFFSYVSLYSVGRFWLTFVRQEDVFLWGLQQAQVIALLGLIVSVAAIVYLLKRRGPGLGLAHPGHERASHIQ